MTWVAWTALAVALTYWLILSLCHASAKGNTPADDDEQAWIVSDQSGWGENG